MAEPRSRWLADTGGERGPAYAERFRALAAQGLDVHGEAGRVAALLPGGGRVLDAGCGTGRVATELARRGYDVVGVDNDRSMLDEARADPAVRWVEEDLAALDLGEAFDLVVCAGNVMVYLAEGTEPEVVRRLAGHLTPGGLLVAGWDTGRLDVATYDEWAGAAGLRAVARYATWGGEPWRPGAGWCVAVDRLAG
jgi:SAM-dependent methyltransferase